VSLLVVVARVSSHLSDFQIAVPSIVDMGSGLTRHADVTMMSFRNLGSSFERSRSLSFFPSFVSCHFGWAGSFDTRFCLNDGNGTVLVVNDIHFSCYYC
jgi:hypothetical protein